VATWVWHLPCTQVKFRVRLPQSPLFCVNINMINCEVCKETFQSGRSYSNHVRWHHKKVSISKVECEFCLKSIAEYNIDNHHKKCSIKNNRRCKNCNNQLNDYLKVFCNSSCSASFSNKNRSRNKWTESQRSNIRIPRSEACHLYHLSCKICGNVFTSRFKNIQTCSKECKSQALSIKAVSNPNCGGETNYKKFLFNDIWFDSSWEVEIAKLLDIENIKWIHKRKEVLLFWYDENNKKRRYYPDFYLPDYNVYLDPKNPYKISLDQYKLDAVIENNNIELIYGDMKTIIEFIKNLNK